MPVIYKNGFLLGAAICCISIANAQTQKEMAFANVALNYVKAADQSELLQASRLDPAEAVKFCLKKAGIINDAQARALPANNILSSNGQQVTILSGIPAGHIIGFVKNGKVYHVMVSMGLGVAIGIKNLKNTGLGTNDKWEQLNLMYLPKAGSGIGFTSNGTSFTLVSMPAEQIANTNAYANNSAANSNLNSRRNAPAIPAEPGENSELPPPPSPAENGPATLPDPRQKKTNQQWQSGQKPVSNATANNQNVTDGYSKLPPPARNNNVQAGQQRRTNAAIQNATDGYSKLPPPTGRQGNVNDNTGDQDTRDNYSKLPPPPPGSTDDDNDDQNANDGYQSLPAIAGNRNNGTTQQTAKKSTVWKNGVNPNPVVEDGRYPLPPPPKNKNVHIGANRATNDGYQSLPAEADNRNKNDGYQSLPAEADNRKNNDGYQSLPSEAANRGTGNKQYGAAAGKANNQYQPMQELPKDENGNKFNSNGFLTEKKNSKGEIEYYHPETKKRVYPVYNQMPQKTVSIGQYNTTPANNANNDNGYQSLPVNRNANDKTQYQDLSLSAPEKGNRNNKQAVDHNANGQYRPLKELNDDGYQSLPAEADNRKTNDGYQSLAVQPSNNSEYQQIQLSPPEKGNKNNKQQVNQANTKTNNQYQPLRELPADAGNKGFNHNKFLIEKKNDKGEIEYYHPDTKKRVYPVYANTPQHPGGQKKVSIGHYNTTPANNNRPNDGYQSLPAKAGNRNKNDEYQSLPAEADNRNKDDGYRSLPVQGNGSAANSIQQNYNQNQYAAPPQAVINGNQQNDNQNQYTAPPQAVINGNQQNHNQNQYTAPPQAVINGNQQNDNQNQYTAPPQAVVNGNQQNDNQKYGELEMKPENGNQQNTKQQYGNLKLSPAGGNGYESVYADPRLNIKNLGSVTVRNWAPDGATSSIANANAQFKYYQQFEKEIIKNINQFVIVAYNFYKENEKAKTLSMANGDRVIYDEGYNLLAVYTSDGLPKMMYCPGDKEATFNRLEAESNE